MKNIIFELEDEVKQQFSKDPFDEKMYLAIKALTEKILVLQKLVSNKEDAQKIAHDYAIILWTRVCNGTEISHWTKYIMLNVSTTLHNHYKAKNKRHIALTLTDPVDEDSFINSMYGSSNSNEYIRAFEIKEYLTNLYEFIKDDVLKFSRTSNIIYNRRLVLSVLANFITKRSLVGLSDTDEAYVEFIQNLVKRSVYERSLETLGNASFEELAKILKHERNE